MTYYNEYQWSREPMDDQILLHFNGTEPITTNIPQVVVHHSPNGFAWGYAGSAPAELALNLCEHALLRLGHRGPRIQCYGGLCYLDAYLMHQEFKDRFIVGLDMCADHNLAWADVLPWIEDWLQTHVTPRSEPHDRGS